MASLSPHCGPQNPMQPGHQLPLSTPQIPLSTLLALLPRAANALIVVSSACNACLLNVCIASHFASLWVERHLIRKFSLTNLSGNEPPISMPCAVIFFPSQPFIMLSGLFPLLICLDAYYPSPHISKQP